MDAKMGGWMGRRNGKEEKEWERRGEEGVKAQNPWLQA